MGILGAVVFIFLSDSSPPHRLCSSLCFGSACSGAVFRLFCIYHYNFYLQSNKKKVERFGDNKLFLTAGSKCYLPPFKTLLTIRSKFYLSSVQPTCYWPLLCVICNDHYNFYLQSNKKSDKGR